MHCSKRLLFAAVAAALAAGPALASPTVNGTVGGGEYAHTPLTDVAEPAADFYDTGLDIHQVHVEEDAVGGSRYLGLTTVGTPFDINGSPASFAQMTGVALYFYLTDSAPAPSVIMNLAFNALGFIDDLSFYREWNGAGWTETDFDEITAGAGNDYEIATGDAMELRLSKSALKVFSGDGASFPSYLRLQLDDTGGWQDDQIQGQIPEPATVCLLALGGLAALRRRRR